MTVYPATFPCPQASMSLAMDVGLVRDAFTASMSRQRRRHTTILRSFEIKWVCNQTVLGQLVPWLNDKGFQWFDIDLPSDLPGTPTLTKHTIRLTSDIRSTLIKFSDQRSSDVWWEVAASAEVKP